jgi:1,4-dihydroxy-2-naphthoyl-CoA synthase
VIVNVGRGAAFQAGADVRELASDGLGMERYRASVEAWDMGFTSWQLGIDKPVIAAVNGICAGGGLHFAADADIVLAASDAAFTDPHVSVGQVSAIETIALMRKIPAEAVLRMALVGRHEQMSAARALELGLVSEVIDPPERLHDAAQELAEKIARNSPAAVRATKRAVGGAGVRAHPGVQGRGGRGGGHVGAPGPDRGSRRVRRQARAAVEELLSAAIHPGQHEHRDLARGLCLGLAQAGILGDQLRPEPGAGGVI